MDAWYPCFLNALLYGLRGGQKTGRVSNKSFHPITRAVFFPLLARTAKSMYDSKLRVCLPILSLFSRRCNMFQDLLVQQQHSHIQPPLQSWVFVSGSYLGRISPYYVSLLVLLRYCGGDNCFIIKTCSACRKVKRISTDSQRRSLNLTGRSSP